MPPHAADEPGPAAPDPRPGRPVLGGAVRPTAGPLGDRAPRPLPAAALRRPGLPGRDRRTCSAPASPLEAEWFAPHFEFRFPLLRRRSPIADVVLELRQAIEPWHVLGEEATSGGTARYVDSSVERVQVKVQGMTDGRHVRHLQRPPGAAPPDRDQRRVRRRRPLSRLAAAVVPAPDHPGPRAAGVRPRRYLDGPVGRRLHLPRRRTPAAGRYDTFPVNANEAESRRHRPVLPVRPHARARWTSRRRERQPRVPVHARPPAAAAGRRVRRSGSTSRAARFCGMRLRMRSWTSDWPATVHSSRASRPDATPDRPEPTTMPDLERADRRRARVRDWTTTCSRRLVRRDDRRRRRHAPALAAVRRRRSRRSGLTELSAALGGGQAPDPRERGHLQRLRRPPGHGPALGARPDPAPDLAGRRRGARGGPDPAGPAARPDPGRPVRPAALLAERAPAAASWSSATPASSAPATA